MTRILLAAGVAALAISAPAAARPGGGHGGGGGGQAEYTAHGGGGGGGGHQRAQSFNGGGRGGGGFAARQQQAPQFHAQRMQNQHFAAARPQHERPVQMRAERTQRGNGMQMRMARQQEAHGNRAQVRMADRQQMRAQHMNNVGHMNNRAQERMAARQQAQMNRFAGANDRKLERQQMRIDRANERQLGGRLANNGVGYGVGGCPPGLADKGCMPPGIARQQNLESLRAANVDAFRASRLQALMPGTQLLAPARVAGYVGQPLSALSGLQLMALPQSVSYLYPDTPDYYYRYGDGYLYQVDRGSNLIAALLPLLAGGYMPGQYLPSSYMSSYVPSYYGLNSFYPASYGSGYGYGYDNLCNRYVTGVVYQVDCYTGMIQDVVPIYGGGYGVGQLLPSAYTTYNVPYQYRSMYYNTPDYNYWYGPGAIYQYDPSTSLITSVAALLSPGFTIGQPLPAGYGMYNVPMAYRGTYYDTPNAWYRYNNGYIYQVDPTTQLVSAIVASVLT